MDAEKFVVEEQVFQHLFLRVTNVSALIFFDAIQRVQRGNSPQLFENFAWNAKRRLRPRGIPRREKRTKQESLPGHDYIRLEEVAAATPSGVGGRAGEPKSENHTDYFTETENKTITNTENRAADFTVIENKRFVAAILRYGCRKIRS